MSEKVKQIFLIDSKKYFLKYIESKTIKLIYKDTNKLLNIIRKIIFKFNLPLYHAFFSDWKKEINKYEKIIILDTSFRKQIVKYIKKKNPDCKVIFYYWNLINKDDDFRVINYNYLKEKNIDEFWTFNFKDSQEYNINYNPQFYTKGIKKIEKPIKQDVIFVGRDKNRKNEILNLKKQLNKLSIKTKFYIIEDEKDFISYDDYLKMVFESKVILDIINNQETGVTLRCMESIFFEKKLITNNKDIKNYDFYNKNNIFIIGEDDIEKINEFIDSDYKKIEKEIIHYYDYENWLKRFSSKEENI